MGHVRRHDTERTQVPSTQDEQSMIIDDDDLPDLDDLSLGSPHNESYGAICAMLTEHMVDSERLNRWLLGLMIVSLHDCDALGIELNEALSAVTMMNYSDMAISGFDSMNTLVGITKAKKKRGRRPQG